MSLYQLGLSVEGHAINGTAEDNWFLLGRELLGVDLIDVDGGRVHITWLDQNFSNLPPNASTLIKEQFSRAHIFRIIGGILMPDKSRNKVHLMWLRHLRDLSKAEKFSWGSAMLAYLFRDLCKTIDLSEVLRCRMLDCPTVSGIFDYSLTKMTRAQPAAPRGRRGNNTRESSSAPPQPQPPVADPSTPITPRLSLHFSIWGVHLKDFSLILSIHLCRCLGPPLQHHIILLLIRHHFRWQHISILGSLLIHHHRTYFIPVVLVGQVLARVKLLGLLLQMMMRTRYPLKKNNSYLNEI
ncbi:hypothetical protein GQ457_03G009180 [Hibiscus cannabinus]